MRLGHQPLVAAEYDRNLTTLRDFLNGLAAKVDTVIAGALKPGSVTTATITDRAVTAAKLAFTATGGYVEDKSLSGNLITIIPSPPCLAYAVGMVFIVHLPKNKSTNSISAIKFKVSSLAEAQVLNNGGTTLSLASIQQDSLVVLGCISASPATFLLLGVTDASKFPSVVTGQETFNGSFENTIDNFPSSWTSRINKVYGGSPQIVSLKNDNAGTRHGNKSIRVTLAPGTNRDWISLEEDRIPCAENEDVQVSFLLCVTPGSLTANVQIPIKVFCKWYNSKGVPCETIETPVFGRVFLLTLEGKIIWKNNFTENIPADGWKRYGGIATPVSGAHFYSLSFGFGDTSAAGTDLNNAKFYLDDVRTSRVNYDYRNNVLTPWSQSYGPLNWSQVVYHGLGVVPRRVDLYAESIVSGFSYKVSSCVQSQSFSTVPPHLTGWHIYFDDTKIAFWSNSDYLLGNAAQYGFRFYAYL